MKRYIKQIDRENFVYPNNSVSNYDNEIIHEVNDNNPTGIINSIDNIVITPASLSFDVNWSYVRNNSELFQNIDGSYTIVSFHLLAPDQIYFKPWKYIGSIKTSDSSITGNTQTTSFSIITTDFGVTGFTSGEYYLETRFIGKRSIEPVCSIFDTTVAPVTPTPNPTSGLTPTPTPTPTVTPSTPPIYIGIDNAGLLNLNDLEDCMIDITISGSSAATQHWINCNYPPDAYAEMDFYMGSEHLILNAYETSATSVNPNPTTTETGTITYTGITSAVEQNITVAIGNDTVYCGTSSGECKLIITNITKISGTKSVMIDPSHTTFSVDGNL